MQRQSDKPAYSDGIHRHFGYNAGAIQPAIPMKWRIAGPISRATLVERPVAIAVARPLPIGNLTDADSRDRPVCAAAAIP